MGYVKTYRLSKNKLNPAEVGIYPQTSLGNSAALVWTYSSTASGKTVRIPCKANTQYIVKPYGDALSGNIWRICTCSSDDIPSSSGPTTVDVRTIVSSNTPPEKGTYLWTGSDIKYIVLQIPGSVYTDINDLKTMIGLYEVSGANDATPSTCEAYGITDWYDWAKKKGDTLWVNATTAKAPFGESEAKGENSKLMKTVKSDPNE